MAGDSEQDNSSSTSSGDPSSPWKGSKRQKGVESAGRSLSSAGQSMMSDSRSEAASNIHAVSYKRGGKVRKTGGANLHKGERVIPKSKVKRVEKMMRKSGMRMKASKRG
jgi:hypothetical protein